MPQDAKKDKNLAAKKVREKDGFLLPSPEEMRQLLEWNRERAKKERKEFMEAYFAAPVRYNIK